MEPITYNENPYLTWWRSDCYEYSLQNKHEEEKQLVVLIEGDGGHTQQFTLNYLDTASFTLPGDGVYDITVTALPLEDEGETEVYEDILIELCQLRYCYLTLLNQLYCNECASGAGLAGVLIGDPCEQLCKDKGLGVSGSGENDYNMLRLAIVQLNAMLFAYLVHVYNYHLKYTGLDTPPATRAQAQLIIKKMWGQIIAFTEACGFDCKKGASGETKKCKSC